MVRDLFRPRTADQRFPSIAAMERAARWRIPRFAHDYMAGGIGREDGLEGLRAAYGLQPRTVRPLVQAVKYRALAESAVDVIDGYSTDGLIDRYGLVVLEDDRGFGHNPDSQTKTLPSLYCEARRDSLTDG